MPPLFPKHKGLTVYLDLLFVYLIQFEHGSILIHSLLKCSVSSFPFENYIVNTLMLEVFWFLIRNKTVR